jgi:hypothetical protein
MNGEGYRVTEFLDIFACMDEHIGYDFLTAIKVGSINALHK